jgi:hypothetical protein
VTTPAHDAPLVLPAVAFRPVRLFVINVALTAGATVLAGLAGRLMFGVFFGIGLLLGLLNALLVRRSVGAITAKEHPLKKAMALNSATRLALITVAALILAAVFRPNGLGAMFGLALFQVLLVFSTSLPVLKKLREEQRTASSAGGAERSEGRTTSDD